MTDLERARHAAALALQTFVNNRVRDSDCALKIHDPEAVAAVDAISHFVVKTIEHYLAELGDERRAGNGE